MIKNGRLILLLTQIALAIILLIVALKQGIKFQGDMLSALPNSNYSASIIEAEEQLFSRANSRIVISISGREKAPAYQQLLQNINKYHWHVQLPKPDELTRLTAFYLQYAGNLLTDDYRQIVQDKSQFGDYFSLQLSQVANPIVSETIANDPSLATANYLEALLAKQSQLSVEGDKFVATHLASKPIVLVLDVASNTEHNFSVDFALATSEKIAHEIAVLKQLFPAVTVKVSGMLLHTAENAISAKWEISVFGSLSLIATMLLVVWAFKSLYPLIWIVLTLSNAMFMGFIALVWVFKSVHVLTLVFGVTLIGLSVDYSLHVLSHKFSSRNISVSKTIFFAFLTTLLSYCLLYFTPLLILKQVAVFVSAGLFAAFVMSYWLDGQVGLLAFNRETEPRYKVPKAKGLIHLLTAWQKPVVIFVLLVCSTSLIKPLEFNDSIAQLNASSPALISAEQYHRELLGQSDRLRIFVYADSRQALLEKEELLAFRLKNQYPDIQINKLSDWLPSEKRQRENQQQYIQATENGTFSILQDYIPNYQKNVAAQFLTYQQLVETIGDEMLQHRYVQTSNAHVSVIDIEQAVTNDIAPIIASIENTLIFNKQQSLTKVLNTFRIELSYWLFGAIIIILLMLFFRFDVRTTCIAAFVILASLYTSLVVAQTVLGTLNLFNLLSAILVIGLAVDYIIFYREKQLSNANVMAISLSAASSLFVFGMLAFSQTPAINSFGITVTIGLLSVYLLAPLVVKEGNEKRSI